MKKIFSFFLAAIAAMAINATEVTIDLANAVGYTHAESGSGAVQVTDGVLNVTWMVGTGWEVAGTEIALNNLTDITNITFDYKADGGATSLLVYLRDSEGNRWWNSSTGSLASSVTAWTPVATAPNAALWDGPSYAFGDKPFVQLGIVANPSSPANGSFEIRNLKIEYTEPMEMDIPLDLASWQWGYNSAVNAAGGKLNVTVYSDWGAVATGWDPEIDLSAWDKIVVVVDHMSDCEGQWFKLKAYLRDLSDSESNQLETTLGLDAADNVQHEMVINLKQLPTGFDITHARVLAIQSEPTGATFIISRVYLAKEEPAARPETAPATPAHDEADVMALYCNHYTTNNYHFNVLGWGGVQTWETLKLGEDSTDVLYCQDMKWEMMTNWDADCYDMSAYAKLHFDLWVPFASKMKVTFEAKSGWKKGISFNLNEGWNTIDADPAWWNIDSTTYDWTDMKYIAFEGYLMPDSTSAEGNPFAFANVYFWNEPIPDYPEAPALPTISEEGVMALFCPAYTTNTVNFAPTSWGSAWNNVDGKFFYTASMAWDGFTNWDTTRYDMYDYDTFICDIYVTVPSNIKITFEALGAGDGGSGWKNGIVMEGLKANEWNHLEIDLLNAPFDSYDFTDLRYLILEGFTNEGTPLGIANAMFVNSAYLAVENVDAEKTAVKRIIDGRLVIEKNGKRYNALGTQF